MSHPDAPPDAALSSSLSSPVREPPVSPFSAPLPGFSDAALAHVLPDPPDGPPIVLRPDVDGFVVEELPLYLPSGSGEHLYLHIEKRGTSTPEVLKRLCRFAGLHERDVGVAGNKDQWGTTTQWISAPARVVEPRVAELADALGVRVLEHARHGNKLRTGHLRGNRFTVVLQGDVDVALLQARAARLASTGCPNYFGAQRFGHDDRVLRDAERFLARPRPARSKREQFWVSAVQSALFNAWLHDRVVDGTWIAALDGDVMMKDGTGAPFECTDPAVDSERVTRGEIHPSGPLYGARMRTALRAALTAESRSAARLGVDVVRLAAHPAFDSGVRRPSRVLVPDVEVQAHPAGATLRFALPAGAYASVFAREIVGPRLQDAAFGTARLERPAGPAAGDASDGATSGDET